MWQWHLKWLLLCHRTQYILPRLRSNRFFQSFIPMSIKVLNKRAILWKPLQFAIDRITNESQSNLFSRFLGRLTFLPPRFPDPLEAQSASVNNPVYSPTHLQSPSTLVAPIQILFKFSINNQKYTVVLRCFVTPQKSIVYTKKHFKWSKILKKVEESEPKLAQILSINPKYIRGFGVFNTPLVFSTGRSTNS